MTDLFTSRPLQGSPPGHAQLTNMKLALRTMMDCQEAGEGSPRLGLFYGFSGYGKSVAAAFVAQRTTAAYVEVMSVWTQLSLLRAIATELGIVKPPRTAPEILERIIAALTYEPRPLIIDEMDHLVAKSKAVELIRDIHDHTSVPILMIGEEALPAKLKAWERFDNRILVAQPAQPASLADAIALRDHYCRQVTIADELVEHVATGCRGVTRRIVTNLKAIQRAAMEDGRDQVDRAWWGNRSLRTGDVPTRRAA